MTMEQRIEQRRRDRVATRVSRLAVVAMLAVLIAGCATGRAIRAGDAAASRGDWDNAVAAYRQALGANPSRVDLKIKLERATQMAADDHMRRARDLEALEQLPGALAEYRKAADLNPSNTLASSKAASLERQIREATEAARPPSRLQAARQQAERTSPIPHLDPRAPLPAMHFPNASVGDLLSTISKLTGINIVYDQGLDAQLSRPYSIDVTETPLEDVLNQILQANNLTYKVSSPTSIFVYQNSPAKRQQFEDRYLQTFYLSHADPAELTTQLTQILGQMQLAVRPQVTPNKTSNALTVIATAPVMEIVENIITSNDKPQPEVLIEAQILEVNRNFMRQLGTELSEWGIGFTFAPEVAPPLTGGTFPPATPPPFNVNTISGGVSKNDFYVTSPTALIHLLESNTDTKTLAQPRLLGRSGQELSLKLGDQVPIPQTVFNSFAGGGPATIPTTSVTYQSVGVNLLFTPRVTYNDEILLDNLTLEKSGLGPFLDIGGQSFPTIVSRQANTALRLRDGESTVIAGLLRDNDRRKIQSLPGLSKLPVLGQIFGNSDSSVDQTDLIMIITPHIVRPYDISPDDLRPVYIGTGENVGPGTPPLLSREALGTEAPAASGDQPAAPPAGGTLMPSTPAPATPPAATTPPASSPEATPVPLEPAPPAGATAPSSQPETSSGSTRVIISAPTPGPDGTVPVGGSPVVMPIQVAGAENLATLSLTITYDPKVLSSPMVGRGSFMGQGGVTATFGQNVDATAGRISMAFSRPASAPGATGSGVVGAISFVAAAPGTAAVTISGTGSTASGEPVTLQFTSTQVVVK